MKQIGNLENGKILLECTEQEHKALRYLADVANGKTLPFFETSREREDNKLDTDLYPALNAIAEWIEVKDRANSLRNLSSKIDAAIGVRSD